LPAPCLEKGNVSNDGSKSRSGAIDAAKSANGKAAKPAAPEARPSAEKRTGRVKFDDRGNAIWEWAVTTGAFAPDVSTERMQKLENSGLSLAEDAPTPCDYIKPNPGGTVKGYNPYDSGRLGKGPGAPRKRDLRKLSEWLKLKKQASSNKPDDDEDPTEG
jgi:hypothetical protein